MKRLKIIEPTRSESTREIDKERIMTVTGSALDGIRIGAGGPGPSHYMRERTAGEFAHKALFLPSEYDYEIGIDSHNATVLVVLKKIATKGGKI